MHTRINPCIQDASGRRDVAEEIAGDTLQLYCCRSLDTGVVAL